MKFSKETALRILGIIKYAVRSGGSPDLDWKVILISFILVNVLSVVLNVLLFVSIGRGDFGTRGKVPSESLTTFNRKDLSDSLNYFQAKEQELERLKKEPPTVSDPSL